MSYYIGIDVGTSSTKALVINASGEVLLSMSHEYSFQTPQANWAECDPADWWKATVQALTEITTQFDPQQIVGIGLSGQMHGLVLLDADGNVLRPCMMWNDQRTATECVELTEAAGGAARVLEITGNPIMTGFTAPKIRWVQKHEPEVWAQVAKILLPKDYIRYCLSGDFYSEVSDASGMSLLDVGKREWSSTMLEACGVGRSQLPELTESTVASTTVSEVAAALTGLKAGTPLIAGGGDQAAAAVGCGIVKPGVVSCSLGTSGVVFAHAEAFAPETEGRLHAFCSSVPGKWHHMGVQLSCAGSYQWFYDTMGQGATFDQLNAESEWIAAGSEGLLFLPYLSGERCPHADPNARGVFFGLSRMHGRGHLGRAVMEGVAFGLRDALELMKPLGLAPKEIVVNGGGAKSSLWRQILADVFNAKIVTVNASEGAAFGAAVLAAVGTGAYSSVVEASQAMLRITGMTEPGPDAATYDRIYPVYEKLYGTLKDSFEALAKVQGIL